MVPRGWVSLTLREPTGLSSSITSWSKYSLIQWSTLYGQKHWASYIGASWPWKHIPWSSQCTVFVLMLMIVGSLALCRALAIVRHYAPQPWWLCSPTTWLETSCCCFHFAIRLLQYCNISEGGLVAMIGSYYSTTLEFYERFRTTCSFTNICKGRLHGQAHLQQFKEINTFVYIVHVKISVMCRQKNLGQLLSQENLCQNYWWSLIGPGLQEGSFTTQLIELLLKLMQMMYYGRLITFHLASVFTVGSGPKSCKLMKKKKEHFRWVRSCTHYTST